MAEAVAAANTPASGKLRIAEIFRSIQGEGIWAGTPSTFVRVSGCNLRCEWCDTKYASWNPEGPTLEIGEVLDQVASLNTRHIVLTGGEPMLFEPVEDLAARMGESGHVITIETAGTVFRELSCDLMSISPKLSNSTPGAEAGDGWMSRHEKVRANLEPLRRLIDRYDVQLKFVVEAERLEQDLQEIENLLDEIPEVSPDRILLMPQATEVGELAMAGRRVAEACLRTGYRFGPRLHVELYGNTKGT